MLGGRSRGGRRGACGRCIGRGCGNEIHYNRTMGEDEEGFATNSAVPSVVETTAAAAANEDAFAQLLVQELAAPLKAENNLRVENNSPVMSMLTTLQAMKLHLPESATARESISGTNIIECLVAIMNRYKDSRVPSAANVLGNLVSGGHAKTQLQLTSAERYQSSSRLFKSAGLIEKSTQVL
jgi:hypothetical protein